MFAIPGGDIASSFAVHCTHLCSKSRLENASCKAKILSANMKGSEQLRRCSRSAQQPSWASLPLAAVPIAPIPAGLSGAPGSTRTLSLEAVPAAGMLSTVRCVDVLIIAVGTERLTFGLLKVSPGGFLRIQRVIASLACFTDSLVAAAAAAHRLTAGTYFLH